MVSGYFSKRRVEFRMPQGPDALGIRWEGPVMEGRMSVEQRFLQDKREAFVRQMEVEANGGKRYEYVRPYAPVIRGRGL